MGLPRLDMVLCLATGAVDILIQGARRTGFEAGDDIAVLAPVTIRRYLPVLGSDGRDLSGG
jgi:hypothetical protein